MENHRVMQYFIMAMLIGIGVPVFALLGADRGDRLAAYAHPEAAPPAAGPKDWRLAVLPSPGAVERGRSLFQANCIACHGAAADGKGAAAQGLVPSPRDFLDADARWTRTREPLDIYKSVSEGSPGTSMTGYGTMLSVEDRWALVHYLGTLPGVAGKYKPVDDAMAASWKPEGTR